MVRNVWPRVGPLLGLLLFPGTTVPAAAPGPDGPAVIAETRWGRRPKDTTRIVFQLDRPVEFLATELPGAKGFEVRLLGTDPGKLPRPLAVGDARVAKVTFRADSSGTVAQISGSRGGLRARAFRLANPPRVVVDVSVRPDGDRPPPAPAPPAVSRPAPADPRPATPESAAVSPPPEEEFEELLTWISGVKLEVEALVISETEEDRARYRRSLAFLLAERGLLGQAERSLAGALTSPGRDPATAFADSVYLAELRWRIGDHEGASAIARNLEADRGTPREKLRLARILSRCRFPALAQALLEAALPELPARLQPDARLLLARSHWDRAEPGEALPLVRRLTAVRSTPKGVLASALVLHADCLWALGKPFEAEDLYERATTFDQSPEEAAWTALQLGNLAHRAGRVEAAMAYYRRARDNWPETFYAAQADWFLRVAEQTDRVRHEEVLQDRG